MIVIWIGLALSLVGFGYCLGRWHADYVLGVALKRILERK